MKVAILCFVGATVLFVTGMFFVIQGIQQTSEQNLEARSLYCETICIDREVRFYQVRRTLLEWRCFCDSGYWQPIP